MVDVNADITGMLKTWSQGDASALDQLTPLVYNELRSLARRHLAYEQPGQTLQPTALVNEVFLRLLRTASVDWQDRIHFFAMCGRVMRRILVDAARAKGAVKRGENPAIVRDARALDRQVAATSPASVQSQLCALDDALTTLGSLDPRRAQVIELRFFGGLTVEETSRALNVSPQTVMRDWKIARAWLANQLNP